MFKSWLPARWCWINRSHLLMPQLFSSSNVNKDLSRRVICDQEVGRLCESTLPALEFRAVLLIQVSSPRMLFDICVLLLLFLLPRAHHCSCLPTNLSWVLGVTLAVLLSVPLLHVVNGLSILCPISYFWFYILCYIWNTLMAEALFYVPISYTTISLYHILLLARPLHFSYISRFLGYFL